MEKSVGTVIFGQLTERLRGIVGLVFESFLLTASPEIPRPTDAVRPLLDAEMWRLIFTWSLVVLALYWGLVLIMREMGTYMPDPANLFPYLWRHYLR
jgi:hypothetical protein